MEIHVRHSVTYAERRERRSESEMRSTVARPTISAACVLCEVKEDEKDKVSQGYVE